MLSSKSQWYLLVSICLFIGCGWSESEKYLQSPDSEDTDSAVGTDSDAADDGGDLDGSVDETCNDNDTAGTCGQGDAGADSDYDTDWDGGTSPYDSFCGDPRFVIYTQEGGRRFRREDIPFKGEGENPEVVIDGFSNFYCPHCATASTLLRSIFANAVYSKRTAYYFHHYGWTSDMSQPGWDAHRAAYAAFRQGSFWEMHDAIFDAEIAPYKNDLYAMAGELGLDLEQFAFDYTSLEAAEYLTRDLLDGEDAGVSGTPTIFVNGFSVIPWTDLQDLLDCLYGL